MTAIPDPEQFTTNTAAADPPEAEAAFVRTPREHEWCKAKMALFLRELAASQSVPVAARAVGMTRQSAYRLRRQLAHSTFDVAWDIAMETGFSQLAHALMERAINGEEVAQYHQGQVIGMTRRFDNGLGRWILENPGKVVRHQTAGSTDPEELGRLIQRIEAGELEWESEID